MIEMQTSVDEALVRHRAFELWKERGCPIGSPEHDWFMAMRSLQPAIECTTRELVDAPSQKYFGYATSASDLPLGLRIAPDKEAPPGDLEPALRA